MGVYNGKNTYFWPFELPKTSIFELSYQSGGSGGAPLNTYVLIQFEID